MDSADDLLGGFGSGAGGDAVLQAAPLQPLKRDPDSTDDFEHLQDSPVHVPRAGAAATQSFLDMERELLEPAPAPTDRLDHLADKFTDSESEDTAGESPLHRPAPAPPASKPSLTPDPAPALPPPPVQAPSPAPLVAKPAPPATLTPEPTPAPVPREPVEPPKPAPVPAEPPKPAPAPAEPPKPAPAPAEPPKLAEPPKSKSVPAAQPPALRPAPQQPRAPVAHVIEAEVIFCQMGLVESLIYWRTPARSGAALGAGLALLVALACCSVVSVLAYASLLALTAAVAFRIYKSVLQAVQKTNDGHPFKWLLETEISVPAERAQALAASATAHLNVVSNELRRLFLVEDLVDSLKFGVLLWCLTYVGACFNGITLIILGWIALFTLPKAYEMNKAQVDANLELARAKIDEISAKVRAAVPLGRKAESEKDK